MTVITQRNAACSIGKDITSFYRGGIIWF